jgi:3-phenylpropionate/trans-cinnamate dioxygenase ferredoxin reductase component
MRSVTIVGASLAGLSAARALREQSYDGPIVIVGDEHRPPYDRPPLSKEFLAGTMSEADITLTTPDDDALDLQWCLGRSAVRLDRAGAAVELDDGERIVSGGVVIATGVRARRLPGRPLRFVHTLRSLDDALELRRELLPGARLVVIGAGFIGSEIASTAHSLGVQVTVVEASATPLAGPLGPEMGAVCTALHADHGVRLITGTGTAEVVGEDRVRAVRLGDGRELPADLVVTGIGALPCVGWLAGSGLPVDGGVLTDERCATGIPGVVAVGDCASSRNRYAGDVLRLEHWTNAQLQPAVAAATLLGRDAAVPATAMVPYFWSDQYGCRLQFAGHRRDGDQVQIVAGDPAERRLVAVYRRGECPVAVFAMNQPKEFTRWRRQLAASLTPSVTASSR